MVSAGCGDLGLSSAPSLAGEEDAWAALGPCWQVTGRAAHSGSRMVTSLGGEEPSAALPPPSFEEHLPEKGSGLSTPGTPTPRSSGQGGVPPPSPLSSLASANRPLECDPYQTTGYTRLSLREKRNLDTNNWK